MRIALSPGEGWRLEDEGVVGLTLAVLDDGGEREHHTFLRLLSHRGWEAHQRTSGEQILDSAQLQMHLPSASPCWFMTSAERGGTLGAVLADRLVLPS